MPTSTGVFNTKTNLMPRWKPQSRLGIRKVGFSVEPRGVGSKSVLGDISFSENYEKLIFDFEYRVLAP